FKPNFVTPRHSHNADCVYYIVSGELHAGNAILKAGDGVFIPADHGYMFTAGPNGAEFLEFRNASTYNVHFKGNDQAHWDKVAAAYDQNKSRWSAEKLPP